MFLKIKKFYYYFKKKFFFLSIKNWLYVLFFLLMLIIIVFAFFYMYMPQHLTFFVDEIDHAKKVRELENEIGFLLNCMCLDSTSSFWDLVRFFWPFAFGFFVFASRYDRISCGIVYLLYYMVTDIVFPDFSRPFRHVIPYHIRFSLFILILKAFWLGYIDISECEWIFVHVFSILDGKHFQYVYDPYLILSMIKNAYAEGRFGSINNYIKFLEILLKILKNFNENFNTW